MSLSPSVRSLVRLSKQIEAYPLGESSLAAQVEKLLANPELYKYNLQYLSNKSALQDAQLYSLIVIKRALLEWKAQGQSSTDGDKEMLKVRAGIAPLIQLLKARRMQVLAAENLRTCFEQALQGKGYEAAYLNLITGGLPWILGVMGTDTHEMQARARLANRKSWLNSQVGFRFLRALASLLSFIHRQVRL